MKYTNSLWHWNPTTNRDCVHANRFPTLAWKSYCDHTKELCYKWQYGPVEWVADLWLDKCLSFETRVETHLVQIPDIHPSKFHPPPLHPHSPKEHIPICSTISWCGYITAVSHGQTGHLLRLEYKNTCCKSDSDSPACLNCIMMMMMST